MKIFVIALLLTIAPPKTGNIDDPYPCEINGQDCDWYDPPRPAPPKPPGVPGCWSYPPYCR